MTVSTTEAKNKLTELLRHVEMGQSVIIERHGKPIAQITHVEARPAEAEMGNAREVFRFCDRSGLGPTAT